MQQRRGTAEQWTIADPVLAAGEIGFESDTNKIKVGDGVNQWSDIAYFVNVDGLSGELGDYATEEFVNNAISTVVGGAPELLDTLNELAAAIGDDADFFTSTGAQITSLVDADATITAEIAGINTSIASIDQAVTDNSDGITALDTLVTSIQSDLEDKLDSSVAAGQYAPINDPTFGGTVSLPSDTSVGDVSSTEIGYLNGVTSAIQTQLDAKAPTADPTFTGTVSGVTKDHVGLDNVDNTADADKPVSGATQTALDLKANLSGAVFTGDVEVETNLVVDGNLTVNGTEFLASATSIVIEDNIVQLSHSNPANTVDLGLVVAYNDGAAKHAGIVRDVSDNTWKLFQGVTTEPATTVDFAEGSLDNLALNNVTVAGVVFTDGTQTKQGVPSLTEINQQAGEYTAVLADRDKLVEVSSASGVTLTIPTNADVAYPVGTSFDILQTGAGQVTIAGAAGVTVNATPGLKLRTQWSSATIFKRAENTWVVYGDLSA